MTMPVSGNRMVVQFPSSHPVAEIIGKLRTDLTENGYAFGCLFMAERTNEGLNFGLFFADGMPRLIRAQLIEDLEKAVKEAKKL